MLKNHRTREAICRAMGPKPAKPRRMKRNWVDVTLGLTVLAIVGACMVAGAYLAVALIIASKSVQ